MSPGGGGRKSVRSSTRCVDMWFGSTVRVHDPWKLGGGWRTSCWSVRSTAPSVRCAITRTCCAEWAGLAALNLDYGRLAAGFITSEEQTHQARQIARDALGDQPLKGLALSYPSS